MQNLIFQSSAKFMHCKKKKKKKKKKTGIFIYTFRRKLCLNSQFKNRFQEVFSIKVVDTKKYTTCT